MGQKIHPTGFRLSVSRNWASRWYASNRDFAGMLAEDIKVREYLKTKLKNAAVSRVLIERPAKNARITIFSARPGVVIGKKGEDIETLKRDLASRLGVPVSVNIEEVRKPEIDAQLIADSITQQLEKRIMFRRDMKRAMQNAMRLGAQGIKIMSSGRLNGIEIARTEWYREGRVPLHTLRADIDYGFSEAKTTYGVIGVKVWVYKGDTLGRGDASQGPCNHLFHDFIGPAIDALDARIDVHAGDQVFVHIAVTAEQLQAFVDDFALLLGAPQFGHRGGGGIQTASHEVLDAAVHEGTANLDGGCDFGQFEAGVLKVGNGLPKCATFPGVFERGLISPFHGRHSAHPYDESLIGQVAHELVKALPGWAAQDRVRTQGHIVKK